MNSIQQLNRFLDATGNDHRISATHISLYLSLFQSWLVNECKDPVYIARREIMKAAKINGIATYHKCIKELNEFGYIRYSPSHHPVSKSKVFIIQFQWEPK